MFSKGSLHAGIFRDENFRDTELNRWKKIIGILVKCKSFCGSCTKEDVTLLNLNTICFINNQSLTLKDIVNSLFGYSVEDILASSWLCDDCIDTIIKAYYFIQNIEYNSHILKKCTEILLEKSHNISPDNNKLTVTVDLKDILGFNNTDPLKCEDNSNELLEKGEDLSSDFDIDYDEVPLSHLNDDLTTLYECCFCNQTFSDFNMWRLHCEKHTADSYCCKYCRKTYKTIELLVRHRRVRHLDTITFCHICKLILYKKNKHKHIVHANKEHLHHYPHLCDFCGESFASKNLLKYHSHKHKWLLNCKHCNKPFKDQSSLAIHLHTCEVIERPYECDICKLLFTSQEKAMFHRRKHFTKDFECMFCAKKYWTKNELNIHKKRIHKDKIELVKLKIYQCTKCTLDFKSKKDVIKHSSTHSEDASHICRDCNATFKSKINYYGHIRRHKIKKDTECPICYKLYDKYNIKTHIKSHQFREKNVIPNRQYTNLNKNTMCDVCGRFLKNEKSLLKHRETHKEQQQCPHCLKVINTIAFGKHLKTHTNIAEAVPTKKQRKEFQCSKCDYSSTFLGCLEAHDNRHHLQVRPFQCDICRKSFYAKLTLKEHIKTHTGLKPEQCHECGNRFVNKKALKMHVRIHTGEKPYACDLCDEKFLSASRRQSHKIRKHFEPTVQCPICLKMYYTQSAVRSHIKDCHSSEPRQRNKKISL